MNDNSTEGWPAAILAAVSKEEQADAKLPSIPDQLAVGDKACQAHRWPVAARISIEGHSRNYRSLEKLCQDCPDYARLVQLIERNQVKVVVAIRYDRIGRRFALIATFADLCQGHEVYPYMLDAPVEPGPGQDITRLWLTAIGAAQVEYDNRTRVYNYRMGQRGRVYRLGLSNATTPAYGYRRVGSLKDARLVLEETEARWVHWMFQHRAEGAGYHTIAQELNAMTVPPPGEMIRRGPRPQHGWHTHVVRRILHNPVYAGLACWREWRARRPDDPAPEPELLEHEGILVPRPARSWRDGMPLLLRDLHVNAGAHPAIVAADLWNQVQRINAANARTYPNRSGNHYLLSGLLQCGLCGDSMSHFRRLDRPGVPVQIKCSRYARMGKALPGNPHGCRCNCHNEAPVRDFVLGWVREAIDRPAEFLHALEAEAESNDQAAQVSALRREIQGIERRQGNIAAVLEERWSEMDEAEREHYDGRRQALAAQRARAQSELEALLATDRRIGQLRHTLEDLAVLQDKMASYGDEDWSPIIRMLVQRIVLVRGQRPRIIPR